MKVTAIEFEGIGPVLIKKNRRARYMRIYVEPFKPVRMTIPYGVTMADAAEFVRAEIDWVKKHLQRVKIYEQDYEKAHGQNKVLDIPKAEEYIIRRAALMAWHHGFTYNKITIRSQKTLWGSCSPNNNISLNIRLYLLPEKLVDYVILHELVHIKIKNHSKKFWQELDKYVGDAKALDRQLRKHNMKLY
jgi:predicted metal-dependent hydrolase